ncbi:hypothetical protein FNV43_RR03102 [Rhamnella rubrinervis]|uniref:Uncharacterized protein n=1 Tax=Rhamnella rubrinervis TaxID=2594499 RepID=A0A8K0HJ71_9ROSA|nr:hypothetical protein FNV43_RR03102 [Rhamnella rubrinervis]
MGMESKKVTLLVTVVTCLFLVTASFIPYANGARASEAINAVDMSTESRSSTTSNAYNSRMMMMMVNNINNGDDGCGSYCGAGSSCDDDCRCQIIPGLRWGICLGGCCDSASTNVH